VIQSFRNQKPKQLEGSSRGPIFLLSLVFALNIAIGNTSLRWVSVNFNQVLKDQNYLLCSNDFEGDESFGSWCSDGDINALLFQIVFKCKEVGCAAYCSGCRSHLLWGSAHHTTPHP
jgi:hypothetical protein